MVSKYLVSALALAASVVYALPPPATTVKNTVVTNAQRLQKGQTPNPPVRRENQPSNVVRALPSPSPIPGNPTNPGGGGNGTDPTDPNNPNPPVNICGRLLVIIDGQEAGYVQGAPDGGIYSIGSQDGAVNVSYDNHLLTPVDGNATYPYIAATVFEGNGDDPADDIFDGSVNIALLDSAQITPYGSPAISVQNSYNNAQDTQTAIFYLNVATAEITVQWVNSDGSYYQTDFITNSEDQLFIGDAESYVPSDPESTAVDAIYCENFYRIVQVVPV